MKAQLLWGSSTHKYLKRIKSEGSKRQGGFKPLQIHFFRYEYKYGIGKTK